MALVDDFTVYPYSKVIRHTNAASDAVYAVQAFYSWLMDLFDEPAYLSYENCIKYNTPTQYTMQNGWFIDNGDGSEALKYLKGGSILTTGYTSDIIVVDCDGASTNFVVGDKDLDATETTTIGPLLAFKQDYPVTDDVRLWIRDTNSHGQVDNNDTVTMVTGGGTGVGTADGNSYTGDEIYTNLYSIASFPSDVEPQVYVFQQDPDGVDARIEEWSFTSEWNRGTIDILIPVQIGGALINSGLIDIFARQSGDSFTHVLSVDLSAGSRTPVALESTADEVNLTLTEENNVDYYMFFDGQTSAIAVDDVITDIDTATVGTRPGWYAEVASVVDWGTTGVLGLRGLNGAPVDGDSIYVGSTDCADVNGTVGDVWVPYASESTQPVVGDLGDVFSGATSSAQGVLRAYQDDGTTGKLLFQVYHTHATYDTVDFTGSGRDNLYKMWSTGDVVTADGAGLMAVTLGTVDTSTPTHYRAVSGFSDVTIAHVNGTVAHGGTTGTFIEGEVVNYDVGAEHAILLYDNTTNSITLGNVTSPDTITGDTITGEISGATCVASGNLVDNYNQNYEFPLQSEGDTYNVFVEGGSIYNAGRTLDQIYAYLQYRCRDGETAVMYTSDDSAITEVQGQQYTTAVSTHATLKANPFGQLAGGVFFGAQGVWIEGMTSTDDNNIKLTSHEGNARAPYLSILASVGNTRVSDVITVFLEDGSTGLPDKSQFACVANAQSASTLQGSITHPNDTPSSGWVYVVDTSANEEHKYRYTSWTTDTLTLATQVDGTAEGGTTGQTLIDTGVFASGVERGDIVWRPSDGAWCYVISVDSANQVTTTVLSDGSAWAVSDVFEVNSTVVAYTTLDTYFIPYIQEIEDTGTTGSPGTASASLTYVSSRAVVIRVRNVLNAVERIVPFVTTSDITTGGMTVSCIRTEDTVYS